MKKLLGCVFMKLHCWLDPKVIDWCYFTLGCEWLTEIVGNVSGWLHDIGKKLGA